MSAAPRGRRLRAGVLTLLCCGLPLLGASPAWAVPSWLSPSAVSVSGFSANHPQVVFDTTGDVTAVWQRYRDAVTEVIQAATKPAGGAWFKPVNLSDTSLPCTGAQIATDPSANATAVWQCMEGPKSRIFAASRPAGGEWQPHVAIAPAETLADGQQVALDRAGNATVVWSGSDGTNRIIEAATRPAGGSWQTPVKLSAPGADATQPRIAIDAAGNATAVWLRKGPSGFAVQAATRLAGGAWPVAETISPADEESLAAQVAVTPAGEVTAVWTTGAPNSAVLRAATKPAGGSWQPVPSELSAPGAQAFRVAADATGTATVVWTQSDGSNVLVWSKRKPAGGSWQPTPDVLSAPGHNAEKPQIAVDAAGNALVAWERSNGSNVVIQATRRPVAGGWQTPADLSAGGTDSSEPQIAFDAAGNATAVWQHFNFNRVIEAVGYDSVGPQLRSLSVPATGTTGVPVPISVNPVDVWSGVAAVKWTLGDGTAAGGSSLSHAFAQPGTYTVSVEAVDPLANASAESRTITISDPPGQGAGPGPAPGPASALAIAARLLKVKGRTAQLKLSCPASGNCAGLGQVSVKLKAKKKKRAGHRHKRARARNLAIGRASFSLAAGGRATLKLKLSARGRALLRRAGRRGLKAQLGGSGVQARAVLLKEVKKKKKKRRKGGGKR